MFELMRVDCNKYHSLFIFSLLRNLSFFSTAGSVRVTHDKDAMMYSTDRNSNNEESFRYGGPLYHGIEAQGANIDKVTT